MIKADLFDKARELIEKSERVLLTTHRKPDGDAVGSVGALAEAIGGLGKECKVLLLSELPGWYEFVFRKQPDVLGRDIEMEQVAEYGADLVIICDSNSYSQLPAVGKWAAGGEFDVLVFDHHVTGDGLGNVEVVDAEAGATAVIIYEFLRHCGWELDALSAQGLFAGLATDTGWFHFSNTDSRVMRVGADLIEAGAEPTKIYSELFHNFSQERFKLLVVMLERMQLHFEDRFATQFLLHEDFAKTGADYEDTEDFIDFCQRIRTVRAAVLIVELPDGSFKCSLRSSGGVDVGQIAHKHGGGGHKMAAGVHLAGPLENTREILLAEFGRALGEC